MAIVTPVLDDWESFGILLATLAEQFARSDTMLSIVAVDDGSREPADFAALNKSVGPTVASVEIIRLTCNLGHQRAIAIGLSLVAREGWADEVVIMDSDGEDLPGNVPELLARVRGSGQVVVATRAARSEGRLFRLSYRAYKLLFRTCTGVTIDFGNFSAMPLAAANQIAHIPDAWNNFAGALLRSRLRFIRHPTRRGQRYAGRSRMNFANLIVHGLGAISVHSDTLLARLLVMAGFVLGAATLGSATVVILRLFTDLATPGWATSVILGLMTISIQTVVAIALAALLLLSSRNNMHIVPAIDCNRFVSDRKHVGHLPTPLIEHDRGTAKSANGLIDAV